MITSTFPNVGYTTNIRQGEVKPGFTDIGFGFSPQQKERIKGAVVDLLVAKSESVVGKIKTKNTDIDSSPVITEGKQNTTTTAVNVANALTEDKRQLLVIGIAAAVFIAILFYAKGA